MSDPWIVPAGFLPVKWASGAQPNYAGLENPEDPELPMLQFYAEALEDLPRLPLRGQGELRHMGWDIGTPYAVDSQGRCFLGNAFGSAMRAADPDHLLSAAETYRDRKIIRSLAGLPPERPEWVATALEHGWSPPPGWVDPAE